MISIKRFCVCLRPAQRGADRRLRTIRISTMKKKIKNVFEGAEPLALLLYICSICTALMYTLCRSRIFITTVMMTVLCGGIFMLFYALRKRKGFSFLAFLGLFIVVNIVCNIVGNPYRTPSFFEFVFRSSDFFQWDYALLSILLFSFIIGFTVAYFSVYLPRSNFLLLPSFIPLILAARTLGGMPLGYMIFLGVGYLAAMLGLSRPEQPEQHKYFDDPKSRKERLGAAGILIALSAVMLIILPRMEKTPYLKYVDNVFVSGRNSYFGRPSLSNFLNSSTPNRGANKPADNVLFSVITDHPRSIIRWSFDNYKGKDGWEYDDDFTMGTRFWQDERAQADWAELTRTLKDAARRGKLEAYKDELLAVEIPRTTSGNMTIQVRDGSSTAVIMHPQGTYSLHIPEDEDMRSYRNPKDEIFTKENMKPNSLYRLMYYTHEPTESMIDFYDNAFIPTLLEQALEEGVIDDKTHEIFLNEYTEAVSYFDGTTGVTPELETRIEALANEITAGCVTDYEKARAIERWFEGAGFVYDMDFVPEESTAEYFLFESKRGICTDFATATTLLLRAAGIPARYTEGFALSEDILDERGIFNVTPAQAHAFSTVYIPGAGWIEIDGTKYANPSNDGRTLRVVLIILVSAAAVLLIVGLIFRRQLSEIFFKLRFELMKKPSRIRAVYLRTRRLACDMAEIPPQSAASDEVCDILSKRLDMGDQAARIADAANLLLYSEKPDISGINERQLYNSYKQICKARRARR